MTYDPATYWMARGRTFEATFPSEWYGGPGDDALRRLLSTFDFETVLDVGCGFGRVGELIRDIRPDARYTGLDVSPNLLSGARRRLPDAELILEDLRAFETDRTWDLVVAVVVLSHQPPQSIANAVELLRSLASRHLVTIDWDKPDRESTYQFVHDYEALFGNAQRFDLGRSAMYYVPCTT